MKKTAVEWLRQELLKRDMDILIKDLFEKAKEMEKNEKLKNQLFRGKVSEIIGWSKVIELMKECNETFKQQEQ
jgi:hypothetical protein